MFGVRLSCYWEEQLISRQFKNGSGGIVVIGGSLERVKVRCQLEADCFVGNYIVSWIM
jgi:hypothetical protein